MKELKLYCMRGVPGCGKSTKAQEIATKHREAGSFVQVFSTDDFWGNPYTFVPGKIREAHLWNQHRSMLSMIELSTSDRGGVLIIDNTHVSAWEMRPYINPAKLLGFDIEIVEPTTPWAFDAEECARRNVHNVPLDTIRGMLARYERNLTVDLCMVAKSSRNK